MLFQNLHVWLDETPRSGAENMAVDEWLIQSVGEVPFLRIYSWDGDWVSLGYFQSLVDAKELFGKVSQLVR
ncbi:MAG: lipoate-protein ligase A, partial [Akkermansiaceae bacterium]